MKFELEVVKFDVADVITASIQQGGGAVAGVAGVDYD